MKFTLHLSILELAWMPAKHAVEASPSLIAEWPLSSSAILSSSVRLKGIEREIRRRLPWKTRKSLLATAGRIMLRMAGTEQDDAHRRRRMIAVSYRAAAPLVLFASLRQRGLALVY
ncbi:hypothetical protein QO058_14190 [Bosea vestrisii]|uniref:hypothetical protein n=1 Tax=Bosea vestrisii TaxID=151416 RepID=UPI0024DFFBE1|nr:hypothetical protein [Bosea vestrisii]WID99284.1 hypothetical protein QO058_14190 [Bosea vestrisii]